MASQNRRLKNENTVHEVELLSQNQLEGSSHLWKVQDRSPRLAPSSVGNPSQNPHSILKQIILQIHVDVLLTTEEEKMWGECKHVED